MTTKPGHFTVHHDGVTIPLSRGGHGRPLELCPGLTSTQAGLSDLIESLRRHHDVISFDLRGHGRSSAADRYTFADFLGDFTAVMAAVGRFPLPSRPVLVGHSLGADLIVHYAADHPDTVAALVVIDGAVPLSAPFITSADLPAFRALWENVAAWHETVEGTPHQMVLTAQQILDLNVELDVLRSGILDRYRTFDLPIHAIMSTTMAGDSDEGRAPRHNRLWRANIERLQLEQPHISVSLLDATHALVVTHATKSLRS